jgi:hypothetical protein
LQCSIIYRETVTTYSSLLLYCWVWYGLFDTSRRHSFIDRSLLTSSDVFDIDMLPCPVGGWVEAALAFKSCLEVLMGSVNCG